MREGAREAFEAVDSGDDERLETVLAADPGLADARDDAGVSLVRRARYAQRERMVDAILRRRPALDVHDAAAVGDVDRLEELVDADPASAAAVAGDGFTPLHLAAFFSHPRVVGALIRRGADPNAVAENGTGLRPLHSAAAADDRDSAALLLDAGADPNLAQRGGFTALHAAAAAGDVELIELLLARGADASARADDGRTARDIAAAGGHAELAERLAAG
jgi:ankyrin repeat protein